MSAIESVMVRKIIKRFARLWGICLALITAFLFAVGPGLAENPYEKSESNLVRVTITAEIHGAGDALAINRQLLNEYNPTVIQKYSSTGIVLDRKDYVMTFLGYGSVFVQKEDSRFEIDTNEGRQFDGSLVGIDQGNGAAVIHVPDGKLKSTPVCPRCNISDGTIVIAPVFKGPGGTQFQETQILSMHSSGGAQEQESWVLRMNRPFLGIGQPIFTSDGRVLGFVVGRDVTGLQNVVYPVSELLASAEKIIKSRGDIRDGWLGVYTNDNTLGPMGYGVVIDRVEMDGPAQKAGLAPSDIVVRYNGRKIDNVRQFIRLVQDTPIGAGAELEILRSDQSMTLNAIIQSRKFQNRLEYLTSNLQEALGPIGSMMRMGGPFRLPLGFGVTDLTPALAAERRIQRANGLLVTGIAKKTPADLAGIKNGDVILSVNGQPADDAQKFSSYLQALPSGSTVSLKVLQKETQRTVSVSLSVGD